MTNTILSKANRNPEIAINSQESTKSAYFKAALLSAAIGKLTAHQEALNEMVFLNTLKNKTINNNNPK
jgi:hypothetical protein